MNIQEIKQAIAEGKKVYWSNLSYEVILDSKGQYLIKSDTSCIGLTWLDGTTLNGKESDFYTHEIKDEPRIQPRISLGELKLQKSKKLDELLDKVGMFFAFNNEQFDKNKTPLAEGDKYVHIGHGGYMPKSKVDDYLKGIKEMNKWYKDQTNLNKLRDANILYELTNYECFYTNDVTEAHEALGSDYTREEVLKVFKKNYDSYTAIHG